MRLAIALLLVACGSHEAAAPPKPARPVGTCKPGQDSHKRFPVGAVPTHHVGRLIGEGSACDVQFIANDVLQPSGGDLRVVAEGWFSATCNKLVIDDFEGVRAAKLAFETTSTHVGLAPMELDAAHPEWTIGLAITPLDRCGNKLDSGLGWDAKWTWPKGCPAIKAAEPMGFEKPANAVHLAPVAPGSCELAVEAYGVRATTTVMVK